MRLADLVFAPWAITPSMYSEVLGIYEAHVRGEKIDIRAVEASLGRPLNNTPKAYTIEGNGVAVLPIDGVMSKRANLLSQISGGASTQVIGNEILRAIDDPAVKSIILQIDSPGGAVDGTQELATLIRDARAKKPIVALADGMMASAAYWAGSAAEKIYITSDTTQVGSIGVVATHKDVSAAEAASGVRTTEITAGKYKRIASIYTPLSPEGRQAIQESVDHVYSVFVDDVAKNRGTDVQTVLEKMADGRVFQGKQAIEAGLVDGVSTLNALIASMSENQSRGRRAAVSATPKTNQEKNVSITKETIAAEYPDIAEAFRAEGRGSVDLSAAKTEAATAERERIQSVLAKAMPGYEATVKELAFDGKTTGAEAAEVVLTKMQAKTKDASKSLRADAPDPVETPSEKPESDEEEAPAAMSGVELGKKLGATIAEHKAKGITITPQEALQIIRKEGTP